MTTKTMGLAIAALAVSAAALPACGDLKNNTVPVSSVAYRPDGSLFVFMANGIDLYDGALVTQITHIPADAPSSFVAHRGALAADGNTAAIFYSPPGPGLNTRVSLFRIPEGNRVSTFEIPDASKLVLPDNPPTDELLYFALSPDGSRLCVVTFKYTGVNYYTTRVLDTATGAVLWTDDRPRNTPIWSPDGATVFAVGGEYIPGQIDLHALDARSGTIEWQMPVDEALNPASLAVAGDGALLTTPTRLLSACTPSGCPAVYPFWSSADGVLATEYPAVPQTGLATRTMALACNGKETCATSLTDFSLPDVQSPIVRVYRTDGSAPLTVPIGDEIDTGALAVSPDGNYVTIAMPAASGGAVTVFRIDDGTIAGSRVFSTDTF